MFLMGRYATIIIISLVVFLMYVPSVVVAQEEAHSLIAQMSTDGLTISSVQEPSSPVVVVDDVDLFGGDPDKWWLLAPEVMQLSPDGQLLALSVAKPEEFRIFIVDIATGSRREVTIPYPATVQWSPDGDVIFVNRFRRLYLQTEHMYANIRAVPGMIYEYTTDTLFTISMTGIFDAIWASDSSTLFFSAQNPRTEGGQDLYSVSRNGSNLQRLTNVREFEEISVTLACGPLAYNSINQRIYFSTGCDREPDVFGFVISVAENGDDLRVESNLDEIAFEEDTVTGVEFMLVTDISIIDDRVNVIFEATVYINSASRRSWRIAQLNDIETDNIIFNNLLESELSAVLGALQVTSFSPTGEFAALAGLGHLVVVDTATGEILLDNEFPDEFVCSFQWQDHIHLLYNVSRRCSWEVHVTSSVSDIPGRVYSLNVDTLKIETISIGNAWIVPMSP